MKIGEELEILPQVLISDGFLEKIIETHNVREIYEHGS